MQIGNKVANKSKTQTLSHHNKKYNFLNFLCFTIMKFQGHWLKIWREIWTESFKIISGKKSTKSFGHAKTKWQVRKALQPLAVHFIIDGTRISFCTCPRHLTFTKEQTKHARRFLSSFGTLSMLFRRLQLGWSYACVSFIHACSKPKLWSYVFQHGDVQGSKLQHRSSWPYWQWKNRSC